MERTLIRSVRLSWLQSSALPLALALVIASIIGSLFAATATNTVATIIEDMTLKHEGNPHGVPAAWDWARRPVIHLGNNPGRFSAMIAWGQVYEADCGNPATNTRVQLRNIRTYCLSRRSGRWLTLQSSPLVEGEAYREDYAGDVSKPG
ncbi:MAG TPA: hypothetical protein VGM23_15350, partial [Armatimonadota bacterium]